MYDKYNFTVDHVFDRGILSITKCSQILFIFTFLLIVFAIEAELLVMMTNLLTYC